MDLSIRKYIYAFLAFVCVMLSAASCVYDDDYDTEDFEKEALQFRVLAPDTKLAYSDLSTSFENDDVVGCVIASNNGGSYTFQTNTKWKYEDGVLMLDADAAGHIQKWNDDSDPEKTEEMQSKGYVQLLGNYTYAFFFYYPYVENLDETYPNKIEWGNTTYLADKLTNGNWTSYPMFVNTDYTDTTPDDDIDQTKLKLNHSDHLWVGYTEDGGKDITKDNATHPVDLTFEKKTATIEIHCDIADGYSIENVSVSSPSIVRGVNLDLSTGLQTKSDNANALYEGTITPGLINTTGKERVYRMMLPAQTINEWYLKATLKGGDIAEPTEYTLPLEEKLSVLEEGKLYILHIAKAGHGYIIINDWNNGGASDLIEDGTTPIVETFTALNERGTVEIDGEQYVSVKAGETIRITGTDLDAAASVRMSGVYAFKDFTRNSENTTLEFVMPATAKDGEAKLVTSKGLEVLAGKFVLVKPVYGSCTYTEGETVAFETEISFTGTDFDLITGVTFAGGTTIAVGDDGCSYVENDGKITVTVPQTALTGIVKLNLANGTWLECPVLSVPQPKVTNVDGTFKKGAAIVLTGENLNLVASLRFPGAGGEVITITKGDDGFTETDGTSITFSFPSDAQDGTAVMVTEAGAEIEAFVYETVAPTSITVSPVPVKANSVLTIAGENLDIVTEVSLPNVGVTDFTYNENKITLTVPEKAQAGKIVLTTCHGKSVEADYTLVEPKIVSITPISPGAGEEITLAGTDLDLVESIKFSGCDQPAEARNPSETQITVTVPATASTGNLILNLKNGTSVDSGVSVEIAQPIVENITGTHKDGATITLTGKNLNLVSKVKISGVEMNNVSITDNGNTLTFVVPSGQNVPDGDIILVTESGGEIKGGDYVTVVPTELKVVPNGTQSLKITGVDLDMVSTVIINNSELQAWQVTKSESEVSVSSYNYPLSSTVVLKTKYGKEASVDYDFNPVVDSINPEDVIPGMQITISGQKFDLVKYVVFKTDQWGNTKEIEVTPEDNAIRVEVPSNAYSGEVKLKLMNGSTVVAGTINVLLPPTVTGFVAENNKFKTGSKVTISGTNLNNVQSIQLAGLNGGTVKVSDFEITNNYQTLTFVFPDNAGDGEVWLMPKIGDKVKAGDVVTCLPTVNSISREGKDVTLDGADLEIVNEVRIDGVTCTIESKSADKLMFTMSDYPSSLSNITIVLETVYAKNKEVAYDIKSSVSVTSVSPSGYVVPGDVLTITGKGLDLVTKVRFGEGTSVEVSPSSTEISAIIPAEASEGNIYLTLMDDTEIDTGVSVQVAKKKINIQQDLRDNPISIESTVFEDISGDCKLIVNLELPNTANGTIYIKYKNEPGETIGNYIPVQNYSGQTVYMTVSFPLSEEILGSIVNNGGLEVAANIWGTSFSVTSILIQ